jgi:hypothetical protein
LFSSAAQLFQDAEKATDLKDRIWMATNIFTEISEIESDAFIDLSDAISS